MTIGAEIYDASGVLTLSMDDYTFRYVGSYSYNGSSSADVIISIPGVTQTTHFAVTDNSRGFPTVETGQVRVRPAFGASGTTDLLHLFRI